MRISIHSILMGLAAFSTTYTLVRFISHISGLPHIGMIILIFVAACIAFFNEETVGRVISTIYMLGTIVISYLVHVYYEFGVQIYSWPWPYQAQRIKELTDNEAATQIMFQKSEASFILLVLCSVVAIYAYLKLVRSDRSQQSQSTIIIN